MSNCTSRYHFSNHIILYSGTEVIPGTPFTHLSDFSKGRLHISRASLGLGSDVDRSVLQLKIGNKSVVFLCSLLPDKSESLQLDLEFEEVDELVFSVIGPRSIYLSGYFLGGHRYRSLKEKLEPYSEKIGDTDMQRSNPGDEDENQEEHFHNKKLPFGKGNVRRRLRRPYQLSKYGDEGCSKSKKNSNDNSVLASNDNENCPTSSYLKTQVSSKKGLNGGDNDDNGFDQTSKHNAENGDNRDAESKQNTDDLVVGNQPMRPVNLLLPSEGGLKNMGTTAKKRKMKSESDIDIGNKTNECEIKLDIDSNVEDGKIPNSVDSQGQRGNFQQKKKRMLTKEPLEEQISSLKEPQTQSQEKEKVLDPLLAQPTTSSSSSNRPVIFPSTTPFKIARDLPKGLRTLAKGVRKKDIDYMINIPIEPTIFGGESGFLYVTIEDIMDMASLDEIGATTIAVYMRHLYKILEAKECLHLFGFIHPAILTTFKGDLEERAKSISAQMLSKNAQLWLAPYNSGRHWTLLVIDIRTQYVYYFDSLKGLVKSLNDIKLVIRMALLIYNSQKSKVGKSELHWFSVACPRQPDSIQCGYYVMRNMKELVLTSKPTDYIKSQCNKKKTYTVDEIDEIREEWTHCVTDFQV